MPNPLKLLRGFFAWWFGELAGCVPGTLRRLLEPRRALFVVHWTGEAAELRYRQRNNWRRLGSFEVDAEAPAAARSAFAEAARGVRYRRSEVVMELPAERVLQRTVDLPLAASENLREVIGFEIDRHTPFRADDAAFDFRVLTVDRDAKRLLIELIAVPQTLVAAALRVGQALGVDADRVTVAGSGQSPALDLNLLPPAPAAASGRWLGRLNILLLAILAGLGALAVGLPLQRQRTVLVAYETAVAESRAAAAETAVLEERLAAAQTRNRFLIDQRRTAPLAVVVLKELTERLPDDTWLVQLRVNGDELQMAGYSAAAAALIARLEESPVFAAVRFDAPVARDPRVGRERFNLSAKFERRTEN